jgi:AcrR family transcriptional regulator
MRSAPKPRSVGDDRTTKARIRDAAIDCFAEHGTGDTTVRKIADVAGVSPALVMHHFGSMSGLRRACDQHVAAAIRERKEKAISEGPGLDILGAIRDAGYGNLAGYLAQTLMEDSEMVNDLVDEIVADARAYIQQGVDNGTITPSDDPDGRAGLLTIWALGGLALHHHLERVLGVDITDPKAPESPTFIRYVLPAIEIVGTGMFTDEFNEQMRAALTPPRDTGEDT